MGPTYLLLTVSYALDEPLRMDFFFWNDIKVEDKVGCFQNTVYQEQSHLYNYTYECLHIYHFDCFTARHLCTKVTSLVLCCITLF